MKRQHMMGFTLVELSVVLLALGLILPGAVILWQMSERHRVETVQVDVQKQSRDALVGFLHANYRLPCPAVDTLGNEDCAGTRQVGYLPWRTLDLPRPEAGMLTYGVYREPSDMGMATASVDRDLAVARDRMNPLRLRTPNPVPRNKDTSPNEHAPPIPSVNELTDSESLLLRATQSGNAAAPLNAACNATGAPPCPAGEDKAVNLIDICLALNTASDALVAPAGRLATWVQVPGGTVPVRRTAAFVLVAPGMLDGDGDGKGLDGANADASASLTPPAFPTFESPSKAVSDTYDDVVLAASHTELFAELQCGAALSAIAHAHFNVATGSIVMERALYDYRDQLYIAVVLAQADVAGAAAGILAGAAGILNGAKELLSATADTTMSAGARAVQINLAIAGIVLAAASEVAAIAAQVDSALSLVDAQDVHRDFADRTTAMTVLSRDINTNALKADAIGH